MDSPFEQLDLRDVIASLHEAFDSVTAVYLFGSRQYLTGSRRSDVDILVVNEDVPLSSFVSWRDVAGWRAVDVWRTSDFRSADSAVNGSRIVREDLRQALDARMLWQQESGFAQDANWPGWIQEVAVGVDFPMTVIAPDWDHLALRYEDVLERQGLPNTTLGTSWLTAGRRVEEIIGRGLRVSSLFNSKAPVLTADVTRPTNEYDFQNLIAAVLRPWIPTLERETVAVTFAGQKKLVDFSACGNKLLIEAKHMTQTSAAAVVKTLEGLADFYANHPNARVLVFAVLVEPDVDFDDEAASSKYTHELSTPYVLTTFLRNAS